MSNKNKNNTKKSKEERRNKFQQNRSFEHTESSDEGASSSQAKPTRKNPTREKKYAKLPIVTPCKVSIKRTDLQAALEKINKSGLKRKLSQESIVILSDNSNPDGETNTPIKESIGNTQSENKNSDTEHTNKEKSDSESASHGENSSHTEHENSKSDSEISDMGEVTIPLKDVIKDIPVFEGYQKDLDYFISVCETFEGFMAQAHKSAFVKIVISKFKGIALAKMQPTDTLLTWQDIKTRLEEKFKRPITYENAQEEISNIKQARNESVETYGNRFRMTLIKLNSASEVLASNDEGRKLLRDTNEKYAVRKFEQNLHNNNLKMWVATKGCTNLDSAISNAMLKENHFYETRKLTCNYCNRDGHMERDCRQKQRNSTQYQNQNGNRFNNNNGNGNNNDNNQPRFSSSSYSPPKTSNNNNFDRKNTQPNNNNFERRVNGNTPNNRNFNNGRKYPNNENGRSTGTNDNKKPFCNGNEGNSSFSQAAKTTTEKTSQLTIGDIINARETKN